MNVTRDLTRRLMARLSQLRAEIADREIAMRDLTIMLRELDGFLPHAPDRGGRRFKGEIQHGSVAAKVLDALAGGGPMRDREIRTAVNREGEVSVCLMRLRRNGRVERVSRGVYQLVGHRSTSDTGVPAR